ncbi:SKI/DACH domain-containing protein 1 [Odontomachus brunneus]|uniref:SKI/DACH domain-containing protein 1 n=1 Tax=Odontomachus brunneus TaxID=486640 RepID=UPI0013F1D9A1|nr:SKI/DACH domain-containing protein 1 [Odontomachus brunneus]XP_032685039.1 SKI/DACH domain-containing protein 1 [Odontomachus brunneus]
MEDSTRLTELSDSRQHHHRRHYHYHHSHHHRGRTSVSELGDDECSTDSGCSSGGSTSSGERLSRRDSDEWPGRSARSLRNHCYLERLRATGRSTRSQDRGDGVQRSSERAWSPEGVRSLPRGGISPSSYSSSPSDAHSGSDSDFAKRLFTTETLRRAFQNLKITSSKWDSAKEKKQAKKSPKKILRSPVSYMYVRGLSGLPTQRVPRNGFQQIQPCSCQDLIGLYR